MQTGCREIVSLEIEVDKVIGCPSRKEESHAVKLVIGIGTFQKQGLIRDLVKRSDNEG